MADLSDFLVVRVKDEDPDVNPVEPVSDLMPRGRAVKQTISSFLADVGFAAGTYTPTVTDGANTVTVPGPWFYQVNSGMVIVSGTFVVTGPNTPFSFSFSLPPLYSLEFTNTYDLAGSAAVAAPTINASGVVQALVADPGEINVTVDSNGASTAVIASLICQYQAAV